MDVLGESCNVELLEMAENILNSDCIFQMECDTEFFPLVRAYLSIMPYDKVTKLFANIKKGPIEIIDNRKRDSIESGVAIESAELTAKLDMDHWKHRALSLIGTDLLPGDEALMLSDFDGKYGTKEFSERHFSSVTTWIGPTSPKEYEELSDMTGGELIGYLLSWHPNVEDRFAPSHEGQARVLEKVVAANPNIFAGEYERLTKLRPTYLRAVISGWRAACEAGQSIPWICAIKICCLVSSYSDDIVLDSEGDSYDDDVDYRNLKMAAVSFSVAALNEKDRCANFASVQNDFLEAILRLAEHAEPNEKYEKKYGGANMDPLSLSINTIRPKAVLALIEWATVFQDSSSYTKAIIAIENTCLHDNKSLAVAAAIGEGLNYLVHRMPIWTEEHRKLLIGDVNPSDWQQVVFMTAMALYREDKFMFDFFKPSMAQVIRTQSEYIAGFRTVKRNSVQLVGDWILAALAMGDVQFDDPLVKAWFEQTPPGVRGNVLNHLCWSVNDDEAIPEEVIARIMRIWDERAIHVRVREEDKDELQGIHWLAMNGKFPMQWWGKQMIYVCSINPGNDRVVLAHDRIVEFSEINPEAALSIFENIIPNKDDSRYTDYYYCDEMAVPILSNAFECGSEELSRRANICMNKLGSMGSITLKDRITEYRYSRKKNSETGENQSRLSNE